MDIGVATGKEKAVRQTGEPPCALLAAFFVALMALAVSAVVGIHLIGAIVVIRSVR